MIVIDNIEQGTDEWKQLRLGVVTASNFKKIITGSGAPSASREKYMRELAGEILSGEPTNSYYSRTMQKGNEREDESRKLYEFKNDVDVCQVGFVFLDESRRIGCSPDGLIDPDGGFETKNAEPITQINRHLDGWSQADHYQQVMGGMMVCERDWWDLQSYSRGIPEITIRFKRDEKYISTMRRLLNEFVDELDTLVEKIKGI